MLDRPMSLGTIESFAELTDQALILVDTYDLEIAYISSQARRMLGVGAEWSPRYANELFADPYDELKRYIDTCASMTSLLPWAVTIPGSQARFKISGRRFPGHDGGRYVVLLMNEKSLLMQRFRLLNEKMDELTSEISKRRRVEKRLSERTEALEECVRALRLLAEIDTTSQKFLPVAVESIVEILKSPCVAYLDWSEGALRLKMALGSKADELTMRHEIPISANDVIDDEGNIIEAARHRLLSCMRAPDHSHIDLSRALLLPIQASGEKEGLLLIAADRFLGLPMESELIGRIMAGAFGGVLARASIEAKLLQAQKMEAIGQLTGGIAHDFNNILTIVLGNSELLLEGDRDPEEENVEQIKEAASRGAVLTSRLLAFARKQPLQPESTDINGLLTDLNPLVRRTIQENISFDLALRDDLWQAAVDRNQLENAIINLAVNSRDAMIEGGCLSIETENIRLDGDYGNPEEEVTPGEYVMVAVSDTGHGMTKEQQSQAFTPFFTTKPVGKGSGLGLSMVYGFVRQSSGHIKISSEIGEGTTIRMYFPRVASKEETAAEAAGPTQKYEVQKGRGSILLVEDDPGVLTYTKRTLEILGYTVDAACDGDEAIECFSRNSYDLLITDVVLPGDLGGREISEHIKQLSPETKVLFISGYTQNTIFKDGKLDQGCELLSKPFTREGLAMKIKGLLKQKQL